MKTVSGYLFNHFQSLLPENTSELNQVSHKMWLKHLRCPKYIFASNTCCIFCICDSTWEKGPIALKFEK